MVAKKRYDMSRRLISEDELLKDGGWTSQYCVRLKVDCGVNINLDRYEPVPKGVATK
jgi:hypothetical protein